MTIYKQKSKTAVYAPIGNYYGTPYVVKKKDGYYFVIENWDGDSKKKISKTFYDAFKKEFGNEPIQS